MKKLIFILIIIGGSLVGGGYLAAILLVDRLTEEALQRLERISSVKGVSLKEIRVEESSIASLGSVHWENIDGLLGLSLGTMEAGRPREFRFKIGKLSCSIVDPLLRRVAFEAKGIQLESLGKVVSGSNSLVNDDFRESLTDGELSVEIDMDLFHPKESLRRGLVSFFDLLKNGRADILADVHGTASFMVGDLRQTAHILSTALGQQTVIFIDRSDIESISKSYSQRLTEGEIDLVATHPLQAPTFYG
ncbi:MAG: hypothetical protein JKY51_10425 [Opitutaceae bacterium]|nr:hypothetical protein [Opitutaceae bacterium]